MIGVVRPDGEHAARRDVPCPHQADENGREVAAVAVTAFPDRAQTPVRALPVFEIRSHEKICRTGVFDGVRGSFREFPGGLDDVRMIPVDSVSAVFREILHFARGRRNFFDPVPVGVQLVDRDFELPNQRRTSSFRRIEDIPAAVHGKIADLPLGKCFAGNALILRALRQGGQDEKIVGAGTEHHRLDDGSDMVGPRVALFDDRQLGLLRKERRKRRQQTPKICPNGSPHWLRLSPTAELPGTAAAMPRI